LPEFASLLFQALLELKEDSTNGRQDVSRTLLFHYRKLFEVYLPIISPSY